MIDYDVDVSSSSSSSQSLSRSSSSSSFSSSIASVYGWHYGARPPQNYLINDWLGWKAEGTDIVARITQYGSETLRFDDIILGGGEGFVSPVMDTGDTNQKWLNLSYNDDESGEGTPTIYVRGQSTSFDHDSSSPTWQLYSGRVGVTWRYVQIKVEG